MRRAFPMLLSLVLLPATVVLPAAGAAAEPQPVAATSLHTRSPPHVVSIAVGGARPALATDTPLAFSAFGASWTAGTGDGHRSGTGPVGRLRHLVRLDPARRGRQRSGPRHA